MSVLVTGGTGAVGFHLLSGITRGKKELISFSQNPPLPFLKVERANYLEGNITEPQSIAEVIKKFKPAEIYHLATRKNSGKSNEKPHETMHINVIGTQNLLEAVRKFSPGSKVMIMSSSNVYGRGEGLLDVLHTEDHHFNPMTTEATSMAAMELLASQYQQAWGINSFVVRPFNYTGPRQSLKFVMPNIAEQIIKIKDYFAEPIIYTGNIDVSRDTIDIRDMTRAFTLLMGIADPGDVYNVCSGKVRTIRELIEMMVEEAQIDVEFRRDPIRERAFDQPLLMGSPEKLMVNTGWKPMIEIKDTLRDVLHNAQTQLSQSAQYKENLLL